MSNEPEFHVRVAIRCFHRTKVSNHMEVCGADASWQRPGATGDSEFFCEAHKEPTDRPIAFAARVPRVTVIVELVVAGTSWHQAHARAEAVERVIQAVQDVGAAVNLHSVLFQTGRYMRAVPDQAARVSEGRA